MKTKYTALAVDVAADLFNQKKLAVTYHEIASTMGDFDSREIKQDRYRIINWLRAEHAIVSGTTTRELLWDVKRDQISSKRLDQYIPAGGRETVGLLFATPETDHIIKYHRVCRNAYACKLVITLAETDSDIAVLRNWESEELRYVYEALYLRQALIRTNGELTDTMRKMLGIREEYTS